MGSSPLAFGANERTSMSEEIPTPLPFAAIANSERVLSGRKRDHHLVHEVAHLQLVRRHLEGTVAAQLLHHLALGVLDQRGQ